MSVTRETQVKPTPHTAKQRNDNNTAQGEKTTRADEDQRGCEGTDAPADGKGGPCAKQFDSSC